MSSKPLENFVFMKDIEKFMKDIENSWLNKWRTQISDNCDLTKKNNKFGDTTSYFLVIFFYKTVIMTDWRRRNFLLSCIILSGKLPWKLGYIFYFIIFFSVKSISDGSVTQNWIFGYSESAENGFLRQVQQGFSTFFAKFLAYLIFFHSTSRSTLKNRQIMLKIWQKMR